MHSNSRYDGQPLLRLLECYVLWAIGELPEAQANSLLEMTPKLRSVYGSKGAWQEIVAGTVGMTSEMPEHLRALWARNLEIARQNGVLLSPQRFAEMVVDDNFVG